MVATCSAWNCSIKGTPENKAKGITFHRFPKDVVKRKSWALATRREGPKKGMLWMPTEHSCLCSKHFLEKDFEVSQISRRIREGVIPSLFNFPGSVLEAKSPVIQNNHENETVPSQNEETVASQNEETVASQNEETEPSQNEETEHSQNEKTEPIPSFNIQKYSYMIKCGEVTKLKRKLDTAESEFENSYKKICDTRKVNSIQEKKMQEQEKKIQEQEKKIKEQEKEIKVQENKIKEQENKIKEQGNKIKVQENKIKVQENKIREKDNKIQEQDNIVQKLLYDVEEHKKLYESVKHMVPDYRDRSTDLQIELITRRPGIPYSEEMKTFAKALREYSPKAYEFLRETLNLPSSRTLRMKKENIDDNRIEFQTQLFQILEEVPK